MKLDYNLHDICKPLFFNFYRAAHVSLIQNESYQQTPKKEKVNSKTYTILTLESLEFIHLCYARSVYFQGLLVKHLVVWAALPIGSFLFTQWKICFF